MFTPPNLRRPLPWRVCSIGDYCIADQLTHNGIGGVPASSTWPTANAAIIVPCNLPVGGTAQKVWWHNGATASGTVDVALYNRRTLTKVAGPAAAVTQAGINAVQSSDITDVAVGPGPYFLAMSASATTTTVFRESISADDGRAMGCYIMTTAHALPTTLTLAAFNVATMPLFGVQFTATV
jgi:hypothetical protein